MSYLVDLLRKRYAFLLLDLAVLEKAHASVEQGASGIIFGRNIFMADKPDVITKALNDVINKGLTPKQAAKKYKLV